MALGKFRVGVISASGTGVKRTLPALANSAEVVVAAVHGRDKARIRELAHRHGVPYSFENLSTLVDSKTVDFVVVCSPPFMHRRQAELLIPAGLPVLFEKPLAHSLADAQAIHRLASEFGVCVAVAHQLRFHPAYRYIKEVLVAGRLGSVQSAFFEWSFRLDPNSASSRWKMVPSENGSTSVSDAGVHCLDTAIGLFGPNLEVLAAAGRKEAGRTAESVDVLLRAPSGAGLALRCSRRYGPFSNRLAISGDQAELNADRFFTERGASAVDLFDSNGVREQIVTDDGPNPYQLEVEAFARGIDSPADFEGTNLSEAVRACELISAIDARLAD